MLQIVGANAENILLNFFITLAIWLFIAALSYWLLFSVLRTAVSRTKNDLDNIILRTVRVPLFVTIAAYGFFEAVSQLQLNTAISDVIRRVFVIVIIAASFYLAWRIVKEFLVRWLSTRASETETHVDDLLVPFVRTIGPLITALLGIVFTLQFLGVDVGLLAASIGAVGLIVGLAFQESLSNLFSGIYLLLDPPFHENELIILPDDKIYHVQRVGLRMTQLYDMSNHALIFVPNNHLTTSKIANITKPTVDMKMSHVVRATYEVEPQRVKTLLNDVLLTHRNILGIPTIKMGVVARRLEQASLLAGPNSALINTAVDALRGWQTRPIDENPPAQAELLQVRKDINAHLRQAQDALGLIHRTRHLEKHLDTLAHALGGGLEQIGGQMIAMEDSRMDLINAAFAELSPLLEGQDCGSLAADIESVRQLDSRQNAMEAGLHKLREDEQSNLDRLLASLVAAGRQVSDELRRNGLTREAANVTLWSGNLATLYAEQEVLEAVNGLDRELADLILWLREVEAGGLSRQERSRVRRLFEDWGGINQMEKRRIDDLHSRIIRWVRWKEQDTLPTGEFLSLQMQWERKLKQLRRKLHETHSDDEELLDTRLVAAREWLHSIDFIEPLTDWKLPGATFKAFGSNALEYSIGFYIDDIKFEHFSRQGRVTNEVLMDIYDVFKSEAIDIPMELHHLWLRDGNPPLLPGRDASALNQPGAHELPTQQAPSP